MVADDLHYPPNIHEIIRLVQRARREGRTIRVRGDGHSVAPAIYADPLDTIPNRVRGPAALSRRNINVSLDRCSAFGAKPTYVVKSPKERLIEVDGGMRMRDLLQRLSDKEHWMLRGTGGIAHQTVAGFTATASAGGSLTRSVNDSIHGFSLIDGCGRCWEVDRGDPEFGALAPNLGLLGVVYKVRFCCEENFAVCGDQATTSSANSRVALLAATASGRQSLTEFLTTTPYARIEWWPQRDAERVVVWRAKPKAVPSPYRDRRPYALFGRYPRSKQAIFGLIYTVMGNVDDLGHMREQLAEVLEHARADGEIRVELLAGLRELGRLGNALADLIEGTPGRDLLPVDHEKLLGRLVREEMPHLFPRLLSMCVPVDATSEGTPFDDYASCTLPMDDTVDDDYMPVEFTEIWMPMGRVDDVMQILHTYFDLPRPERPEDERIDAQTAYERTGTFAIELYATEANQFWLNPAYSDGGDIWKEGAFRVNPFWYGRNAEDPAVEFFPQFWDLLRAKDIPYRLHWGKYLPLVERDPGWVRHIRAQYARWHQFLELRRKRDPDGIFLTEYWRDHLGLSRRRRIAEIHCHYPMHLLAARSGCAKADRKACSSPGSWWLDGPRAFAVRMAAHMHDFRGWHASWRVSLDWLERAHTGLVLSALYDPVYELLVVPGRQRPRKRAFDALLCQLRCVEDDLKRRDPYNLRHIVVRNGRDLARAKKDGLIAFVHCVEGGFHLSPDPAKIAGQIQTLARLGVAYITLAHLFYRGVATNAPALPMLSDRRYNRIFHQHGSGLSERGEAAIKAMYDERVLVDLAHMDAAALKATFTLLDKLDGADTEHPTDPKDHPVIMSHGGYRFGDQRYMLDEPTILEIKRRDGVIGLILARHQLDDGLCEKGDTTPGFRALQRHIQAIYDITGSHDYTCIGSDLDGFIKPTVSAIETSKDLEVLEAWLRCTFPDGADAILFDNAERVVRQALRNR
jgi:microsomal dipeptidase-like Zn-dependent dipeptidase